MAKILIIDTDGVMLSFAWRCTQAGHEVRWFLADKPSINKETGDGFKGITKVANWVPSAMWADLIVPASNDMYVERLDFFRKKGAKVFGPTVASANLEISRKTGMEAFKKCGIDVAPYETFKNFREAAKYVAKTKKRYVAKTLGDNEDKSLTYVSRNAADMIQWIEKIVELKQEPKGEVMMQTFIKGIEMGVSRFVGSKGFIGPWNESWEYKKLMASNYGPQTGEMGDIAHFSQESKLGKETLAKCEKLLVSLGHMGDAAIGFMIDEDGKPWPTEWTCRLGWPEFNLFLGAIQGDPAQWMIDAFEGKDTTSFKEDIGACLVLAHKDFPHGNATQEETSGMPIYGVTKGNKKHLHPQGVKIELMHDMDGEEIVKRPTWTTSGDYALVVTGFGDSVEQATSRAYKTAEQLHIQNMILRDDIGESMEESLPKLHKMGYATNVHYRKGNDK